MYSPGDIAVQLGFTLLETITSHTEVNPLLTLECYRITISNFIRCQCLSNDLPQNKEVQLSCLQTEYNEIRYIKN